MSINGKLSDLEQGDYFLDQIKFTDILTIRVTVPDPGTRVSVPGT